jgi:hypothetical protein
MLSGGPWKANVLSPAMPALRNSKHEAYARGIVKGLSGPDAYLSAGYKSTRKSAEEACYRLNRRADIKERIDELGGNRKAGRVAVEQVALGVKMGRPTLYRPELCAMARRLALLNLTESEMADALNITPKTLSDWKAEHPEFSEAIRRGGVHADARVAEATYYRAVGYRYPAVKIMQYEGQVIEVPYTEHYPPDTNAQRMWLLNRQRGRWVDRQELDVVQTIEAQIRAMTPEQRAQDALELAERIRARIAEARRTIEGEATEVEEV